MFAHWMKLKWMENVKAIFSLATDSQWNVGLDFDWVMFSHEWALIESILVIVQGVY